MSRNISKTNGPASISVSVSPGVGPGGAWASSLVPTHELERPSPHPLPSRHVARPIEPGGPPRRLRVAVGEVPRPGAIVARIGLTRSEHAPAVLSQPAETTRAVVAVSARDLPDQLEVGARLPSALVDRDLSDRKRECIAREVRIISDGDRDSEQERRDGEFSRVGHREGA